MTNLNFRKKISRSLDLHNFAFALVISLIIGVGFYVAYKLPLSFMLKELDLFTYYPLFSSIIAILVLMVLSSLNNKKIGLLQYSLTAFTAFIVPLLLTHYSVNYKEMYSCFVILPYLYEMFNYKVPMAYGMDNIAPSPDGSRENPPGGGGAPVGNAPAGQAGPAENVRHPPFGIPKISSMMNPPFPDTEGGPEGAQAGGGQPGDNPYPPEFRDKNKKYDEIGSDTDYKDFTSKRRQKFIDKKYLEKERKDYKDPSKWDPVTPGEQMKRLEADADKALKREKTAAKYDRHMAIRTSQMIEDRKISNYKAMKGLLPPKPPKPFNRDQE